MNVLTLSEFRGWLNKKFAEGKVNNISQVEHWMDIFEREKVIEKIEKNKEKRK